MHQPIIFKLMTQTLGQGMDRLLGPLMSFPPFHLPEVVV